MHLRALTILIGLTIIIIVSSVTAVIFVGSKTKLAYSTLMTLSVTTNVSCVCTVHVIQSGQSSAVADFNLLDTARKVELYGIQMHSAKVVNSLRF